MEADTDTDTEVLVEINVISAQELKKPPSPSSASIRSLLAPYAVLSLSLPGFPKLRTRVDRCGGSNPTWNDRFVFLLPSRALLLPSSPAALSVDVLSRSPYRVLPDAPLGSCRILLSNLRLLRRPPDLPSSSAFGIRRRSGRLKGLLNVGFALLSRVPHRLRLALARSPALAYPDLLGPTPTPVLADVNADGRHDPQMLCGFGGMRRQRIHVSASDENLCRPPSSSPSSNYHL